MVTFTHSVLLDKIIPSCIEGIKKNFVSDPSASADWSNLLSLAAQAVKGYHRSSEAWREYCLQTQQGLEGDKELNTFFTVFDGAELIDRQIFSLILSMGVEYLIEG